MDKVRSTAFVFWAARVAASLTGAWSSPVRADEHLTLWYKQPARTWEQALPLGNGRLGAMVFGTSATEQFQLNEESLWAGEPFDVYPENAYTQPETGNAVRITRGSTYHMAIVHAVFDAVIQGSQILNQDAEYRDRLTAALAKLPPVKIGRDGTIQEWLEDYDVR